MSVPVRLPDPHALAALAAQAALDIDQVMRTGVTGDRLRVLARHLEDLVATDRNYGAWLSPAGGAVHVAIDQTAPARPATTSELRLQLQCVSATYARAADVLGADLDRLRCFSISLSRAASA